MMQLATYSGWRLQGVSGGLLFVLRGAAHGVETPPIGAAHWPRVRSERENLDSWCVSQQDEWRLLRKGIST
jgi:hypothetical protein